MAGRVTGVVGVVDADAGDVGVGLVVARLGGESGVADGRAFEGGEVHLDIYIYTEYVYVYICRGIYRGIYISMYIICMHLAVPHANSSRRAEHTI